MHLCIFNHCTLLRRTIILILRSQFRSNWAVDSKTGQYSTSIPSPTGIASDPALAGHGVNQSHQLAAHLKTLDPPIQRFYSSPFYRCIQTILPTVEALSTATSDLETKKIRAENGLGEWYGLARFDHPSPADFSLLKKSFPHLDEEYKAVIKPSVNGESIDDLHNRVAYALHRVIEQCDKEGVKAIVICTHGATLIAIGRALVGRMPEDISEQDFNPFTCGLTTFVRKSKENTETGIKQWEGPETEIPEVKWREGRGVCGGWTMTVDGDCSFLADGEERGW
jgi:transcription factor C subunit 7